MEKIDSGINSYNHTVTMIERKSFVTSGVKKIENFDETQFLLDTVMGFLLVKGEGLELIKLDTLLHICEGFGISITEFFENDIFKEVEQD